MPNKKYLVPLVASLVFLIAGFLLYGSAGHDDSHITFWASYTLKEFGEIVNYNGDRIEQSSSLLLTVITALFAFLCRSDVVVTGYLVTTLSGAGAIIMTWILAQRFNVNNAVLLLLATSPAFLLWNTSGMESTLAALCLLWFIVQWGDLLSGNTKLDGKSITLAATATLCLVSVRPEMITLAATLAFVLFAYRRFNKLRSSVPLLVFYSTTLLCIGLLLAFRLGYFGKAMPLPVFAKVSSLTSDKLWSGCYYFLVYGFANIVFVIGSLIALAYFIRLFVMPVTLRGKTDFYTLLGILALLSYDGFILLSGGDWMQMGRFLVPVLPIAAIFCIKHFQSSIQNPLLFWLLILLTLGLNINGNWSTLENESHGTPAWASYHISPEQQQRYSVFEQYNQEHLRDMDVIDTLDDTIGTLVSKGHQPVTLMSGQSGMVFFYLAKKYFSPHQNNIVHFYDSRGLVENSFLTCHLLNDVPRNSQGIYSSIDAFFENQPGLFYECNIPTPDILYDLNDMTRQLPDRIAQQGYTLLQKENGKMIESKKGLPIYGLYPANFIMVKHELLSDLGNPETRIIRYGDKPLVHR